MKNEELFNISEGVAVVTGGGGVLCGDMAKCLAANGMKVAVLDLKVEFAQKTVDTIKEAGGVAVAVECNVLEKESIEKACEAVVAEFGTVDVLVNGAGGNNPRATTSMETLTKEVLENSGDDDITFFDLTQDGVRFVFDLNFIGSLLPSQVFGKVMAKKGAGNIINISSMNAYTPLTKIPAYSAAKAAISNFTQWLAVHFAPVGIRVNAIAPGFFVTAQNKALLVSDNGDWTPRAQKILDNTPQARFGKPEELLGAMVYLLSPSATFVTGICIPVDGGFASFSGV